MAVALKSNVVSRRNSSKRSTATAERLRSATPSRSRRTRTRSTPAPSAVNEQVVKPLPERPPLPFWVTVLVRLQQTSSVVMVLLVAGALSVYGWTVYVQQRWGQEYQRFESLRTQERQLISSNEALKNEMAEQAEAPGSGLMVPDPDDTIFLAPAPPRPLAKPNSHLPAEAAPVRPMGY